eukprot:4560268-Heterocapsa_arctica.AAC.1
MSKNDMRAARHSMVTMICYSPHAARISQDESYTARKKKRLVIEVGREPVGPELPTSESG